MIRATWGGIAVAGLLAATLDGCAHGTPSERSPRAGAQSRAPTAAERAAQAEADLGRARQRLAVSRQADARAEQQRGQARQQLSQAEQRAFQARRQVARDEGNLQRLEVAAREARRQAEDEEVQAQLAAEQAEGLRTAAGRIAEASPSQVVLDVQGGGTMAFQVDPRTRVLVGTEQRSLSDLQQGAEVRVAYDPHAAEPAAVTIHVSPAREQMPLAAPAGQSPQSQ